MKHPHFGLEKGGLGGPRYCAKHRTQDMVDVKHPRCHTRGCAELRMVDADGNRAQRCAMHEAQMGKRRRGRKARPTSSPAFSSGDSATEDKGVSNPENEAPSMPGSLITTVVRTVGSVGGRALTSPSLLQGRGCRKRKPSDPDKVLMHNSKRLSRQRVIRSRRLQNASSDAKLEDVGDNEPYANSITPGNNDLDDTMTTQGEEPVPVEVGGTFRLPKGLIEEDDLDNSLVGYGNDLCEDRLLLNLLENTMFHDEEAHEAKSGSDDGLRALQIPDATASMGGVTPQVGSAPLPHEKLSLSTTCRSQALVDQALPWGTEDMEGHVITSSHVAPPDNKADRMEVEMERGQGWNKPFFLGDNSSPGVVSLLQNEAFPVGGEVQDEGRVPVATTVAAAVTTSATASGVPISETGLLTSGACRSHLMMSLAQQQQLLLLSQLQQFDASNVAHQSPSCSTLGSPSSQQLGSTGELNISTEDMAAVMVAAMSSPMGTGSLVTALPSPTYLDPTSICASFVKSHQGNIAVGGSHMLAGTNGKCSGVAGGLIGSEGSSLNCEEQEQRQHRLYHGPLPSLSTLSLGPGEGHQGSGTWGPSERAGMFAFPLSGPASSSTSQTLSSSQSQPSPLEADMSTYAFGSGNRKGNASVLDSPASSAFGTGTVSPMPGSGLMATVSQSILPEVRSVPAMAGGAGNVSDQQLFSSSGSAQEFESLSTTPLESGLFMQSDTAAATAASAASSLRWG
ncbi:unnamed protein product [Discosporangium mesarthrocarpum]